jgi:hypothetical protein
MSFRRVLFWIVAPPGMAIMAALAFATRLPDTWEVEVSKEVHAAKEVLLPLVSEESAWPSWADTSSDAVEILKREPNRVAYRLRRSDEDLGAVGFVELEPTDTGVRVHWSEHGFFGGNLVGRLLRTKIEQVLEDDLREKLARLEARARP